MKLEKSHSLLKSRRLSQSLTADTRIDTIQEVNLQ